MSDPDQITALSDEGYRLFATVPTLKISGWLCNKFEAVVSWATLLLLTQFVVCCIDQLNSRPIMVVKTSY